MPGKKPGQSAGKMMLIDTSRCMACRGCQVACKDWHQLPAEETAFTGTYENPPDLSAKTLTRVRFTEVDGAVFKWLFFKDQCRHCKGTFCATACKVSGAIVVRASGAVVITDNCDPANRKCRRQCEAACPFGIPRNDGNGGKETKCDWCFDRIEDGKLPMCVKTCPPGALVFDEENVILNMADDRVAELQAEGYTDAKVYPPDDVVPGGTRVKWVLLGDETVYGVDGIGTLNFPV